MNATLPLQVAASSILNFAVAGETRSGAAIVCSILDQVSRSVCHMDLLASERMPSIRELDECEYDDPATLALLATQDEIRREAHESYFGPSRDPELLPEWLSLKKQTLGNPRRYLNDQVFDNPQRNENRIGVRLTYRDALRHDLFDFLYERWQEGDFCCINVLRNPIACLVSRLQAQQTGVWREILGDRIKRPVPSPVSLPVEDVIAAVQQYEATKRKLQAACSDLLEIRYVDLRDNLTAAMEKVFEFLELPQQKIPKPTIRRIRNREMPDRISNMRTLRKDLPRDVAVYLDQDLA